MTEKHEIVKRDAPMADVNALGTAMVQSGMFGLKNMQQGAVLAFVCLTEGRSPLSILNEYHVIEGRLSKKTEAMLSDFQKEGGKIKWLEYSPKVCTAVFTHPNYDGEFKLSITLQELMDSGVALAKAGTLKDNYQKFPRQMLRARVLSEGIRAISPNACGGLPTPEEASDMPPLKASTEAKALFAEPASPAPTPQEEIVDVQSEPSPAPAPVKETEEDAAGDTITPLLLMHGINLDKAKAWFVMKGVLQPGQQISQIAIDTQEEIREKIILLKEVIENGK